MAHCANSAAAGVAIAMTHRSIPGLPSASSSGESSGIALNMAVNRAMKTCVLTMEAGSKYRSAHVMPMPSVNISAAIGRRRHPMPTQSASTAMSRPVYSVNSMMWLPAPVEASSGAMKPPPRPMNARASLFCRTAMTPHAALMARNSDSAALAMIR